MKQFRFFDWQVYTDAQELFRDILTVCIALPQEHKFDLGNQLKRSAFSIILNIAEGSGKYSDKDLNRFLDIALGSAYETLAGLDTLHRNNLLDSNMFNVLQKKITSICQQLGGLKKHLKDTQAVS